MSSERLKSNTPNKWKQQNSAMEGLKVFILISMLTFALLCAGLLIIYLAKPLEFRVFIRNVTEWTNR
jgi:hypothetical protein